MRILNIGTFIRTYYHEIDACGSCSTILPYTTRYDAIERSKMG